MGHCAGGNRSTAFIPTVSFCFPITRSPKASTCLREYVPQQATILGLRPAYFYDSIACSHVKARLGMHGRSVQHAAIFQRKTRGVVGTHNAVSFQFAFRERPAEMRARFRHGKE